MSSPLTPNQLALLRIALAGGVSPTNDQDCYDLGILARVGLLRANAAGVYEPTDAGLRYSKAELGRAAADDGAP